MELGARLVSACNFVGGIAVPAVSNNSARAAGTYVPAAYVPEARAEAGRRRPASAAWGHCSEAL